MENVKKHLEDVNFENKKALVRVDLNVPFDSKGNIADETRIQACIPTVKYILKRGGSVVLISHLGRPKGQKDPSLSLEIMAKRLSELLERDVKFVADSVGAQVQQSKQALNPGEVLLLENLRFYEAEECPEKDPSYAQQLVQYCDLFVNDAFSTSHRKHSSITQVAQLLHPNTCMGLSMAKEEQFLKEVLIHPKKPFIPIIGGAKISSKIGVIKTLLDKADALIIGGAMAHTFLKVMGNKIGSSMNEAEYEPVAAELIELCKNKKISLILPVDLVVAPDLKNVDKAQIASINSIPDNFMGVDVGPETLKHYEDALKRAQTVFWNGPLGVTEVSEFSKGTERMAQILAGLQITTLVGGGDSVAALKKLGLSEKMTYIATGGGASLEYIELGTLPGVEAIANKK
ncbi:MAG: Phosphoglycerate kinase [Chlamydiae bacterium]|nr:Phosphoglycerate kinase [Chlamydiota bacterium]